jgi:sigma-B regulation protein RsbU (phosphoserine phosphatase)
MSLDHTRLQHQLEVYKGLVEVSALINGIMESDELLPAILDVARRVMDVEAASLFLVDSGGNLDLDNRKQRGRAKWAAAAEGRRPTRTRNFRLVLEHGQSLLVPDAYADSRFYKETDRQTGFRTRSILCAPLTRNGKEIGVLQVLNPVGRKAFDLADLAAFEAYGNLAATAIDKLRAIERRASSSGSTRSSRSHVISRKVFCLVRCRSATT